MKQLLVFLHKEIIGGLRSKKILIIGIVFSLIGILSPFLAKIMPELFEQMTVESISITVGTPTSLDAWLQYYNNIGTMGLLVFIILFADTLSGEIVQGTLIQLVTKGLSKQKVLIAKAIYLTFLWSMCFTISAGLCQLYTHIYFTDDSVVQVPSALISYWLFGILAITVMILGSSFAKSVYQSLLFVALGYLIGLILNTLDVLPRYNPYRLSSQFTALVTNQAALQDYTWQIVIALVLCGAFLIGANMILKKRSL